MGEPLAGISDWKKVALLGQGKASKVYLRVAPHGEPFAIKEIDRAAIVAKGSSETARVVRERDVMRALQHAGLARLRGTDKDDQFLRFVMEPVLGGPLYKHIRAADGGRLEASRSRFYAAEIVSSVAYMHGRGYMHRDLKASNVLLDLRGHVVLVDFGCARKIVEKTAALIVALLEVDPARRLGSRCSGSDPGGDEKSCYCYGSGDCSGDSDGGGGCWASDGDAVKAHPWFRKCGDWKAMERRMGEAPPFRRDVGDLDLLAVDCPVVLDVAGKDPFAGF